MKNKIKRPVGIVVISDLHLGTRACHAIELLNYLKSIKPKMLILNGDIIDIWQFHKYYWPKSHMKVLKYIIGMAAKGTAIYYITGNHDELLRKFSGLKLGSFHIVNKLDLRIGNEKAWFFHGDVFDIIIQNSKWLAKLGAIGYDSLVLLNIIINKFRKFFGRGKVSISKKIKENVKLALKYIMKFEDTAIQLADKKGFKYVICGHIHYPEIKTYKTNNSEIVYLNSGDWVENMSALEYNKGEWKIYLYKNDPIMEEKAFIEKYETDDILEKKNKEVFHEMLNEFKLYS